MAKTIAIVEDEPSIRDNYAEYLRRLGYRVETYGDHARALTGLRGRLPDLAILDIGLGDEHEAGFDLCRELRALSPRVPIIFLTARDDELDAITGLRLGADDYLTKDISLTHLGARVAALFRRLAALSDDKSTERVDAGDLLLDCDRLTAHWRGGAVDLTLTEFWLVRALARHPGHVRSREQLMESAEILVDPASINTHIRRIRRKFQAQDPAFQAIESVYGIGYRWVTEPT